MPSRPSSDTNASTMRYVWLTLFTCTPCCATSSGNSGSAARSLFCTCTCAMSGSVPASNVSVICESPVMLLSELMYSRPSRPTIFCSMTCVTLLSTVCAEAPG